MTFVSCEIPGKTFLSDFKCLDTTTPGMEVFMVFMLSYLCNDIVSSYRIWSGKAFAENAIHHSIGILGVASALAIGRIVGVVASCLMLTEVSTLFLNNMFIFKLVNIEKEYPRFLSINSLLLGLTFLITRIVF